MLEKAELTLIIMLSKTKKVITTPPPVLCSVASCKLFYSTVQRVGTLSLLFVPPAKGGGMEIIMNLPPRYKSEIYLYYYEGYNSGEIGEMIGRSASGVRNDLQKARKLLKEELQNGGISL